MKKARRLLTLALAVLMIMALTVPAMAAGSHTITIETTAGNRVYNAYQIFVGDIGATEVTHIEWGSGVTEAGQAALLEHFSLSDTDSAQDVARNIQSEAEAKVVAKLLNSDSSYLGTAIGDFTYDEDNGMYTLTNLASGYYLIVDNTSIAEDAYDSRSAYMMQLVKDITITPKDSIPTLDKSVSDINDSHQAGATTHQPSADYDIGDSVPFHIHIELGNDLDQYTEYQMIITDTLSKGLTYDNNLVVNYGTHTVDPTCYTVSEVTATADGGSTFTVTIPDLYKIKDATTGDAITPLSGGNVIIEYTALLNDQAVMGTAGNPNTANLKFSNEPDGDGMGKTPDSTAIVFTYQLIVNKVDQDQKPLSGAEFTLYKRASGGEWNAIDRVTVTDDTTFTFKGLDDGTYKLVESKQPSGYNAVADMIFTVKAEHDATTITSLTGEKVSGTIELTADMDSGSLNTTVVNEKGATLPSTGGIGTTIFYVVGGVLVVAAVVLLVTKKRMSYED